MTFSHPDPDAHTSGLSGMGRSSMGRDQARWVGLARLGIGLGWGLVMWWLYRAVSSGATPHWPATQPQVFGPLFLVCAYIPFLKLAGIGRLRWRTYGLWILAASIFVALIGWHDVARKVVDDLSPPYLSWPMSVFIAAALFIGHHLVAPADAERRWIASFPAYFDTAWKAGVQLVLSLAFTGAFWLLLHLGAALFRIIGLKFLDSLIGQDWFFIPVTTVVFAVAVHLTDVRDGLIRGVRSVVLMLLSWLLLVMTVLVAGFLVAMPFTGFDGLWKTGSATALVLSAAGALIVLINTAYQDGRPDTLPPVVLRIAVRVASVLLTPLILIALWGLALRIGQHGLTPDRIIASACALVGVAYAAGYGFAALIPFARPVAWMKPLERTNVVAAVLQVVLIVALFSPLADPARISVTDQMARLERGKIAPDKFDYRFLRFDSGKAGQTALARLAASADPAIAAQAKKAQAVKSRYDMREAQAAALRTPVITAWPAGSTLPKGFIIPVDVEDQRANCRASGDCVARAIDLNGDGKVEIVLANSYVATLYSQINDVWVRQGLYNITTCEGGGKRPDARDLIKSDKLTPKPAPWPDLHVEGQVLAVNADRCPLSPKDPVIELIPAQPSTPSSPARKPTPVNP